MPRIRSKGWSIFGGRRCSICGQPYNRRNLTEVWDQRNPGHRLGWNKTIVKMCMRCFSIDQALRLTAVIAVMPGQTKEAERRLEMLRKQIEKIKQMKPQFPKIHGAFKFTEQPPQTDLPEPPNGATEPEA